MAEMYLWAHQHANDVEDEDEMLREMDKWRGERRVQLSQARKSTVRAVSRLLAENGAMRELLFSNGAEIGDGGALVLAEGLAANKTLVTLMFYASRVGPEGCSAVAGALEKNTSLVALDFGNNAVLDAGAGALACLLETNRTLQFLGLGNCAVKTAGARAIGRALAVNTTLRQLQLGASFVGEDGVLAIAEGLKENSSLSVLMLLGAYEVPPAAAELLADNTTLTKVEPEHCLEELVARNRALWLEHRDACALIEREPDEHMPWLIPDLVRIVLRYATDGVEPWAVYYI